MLKLPAKLPAPRWETFREEQGDEPAIRVRFAPITSTLVAAARRAVSQAFRIAPEDVEAAGDAMSRALLARGIIEWSGIGIDSEGGEDEPVAPTQDIVTRDAKGREIEREPGTISLFLSDQARFDWADRVYVLPWVREDQEKNASSASPGGTGVAATQAADTASSAASPATAAADASPTKRTRSGAAPTGSKSRKRTKV